MENCCNDKKVTRLPFFTGLYEIVIYLKVGPHPFHIQGFQR